MLNQAVVYWIKSPQHTDITQNGYIGVSIEPEKRIKTHIKRSISGRHGNKLLKENIVIGNYIVDIVCISSEDYCYTLERKLRPLKNIGWNQNIGGDKPPSQINVKREIKYGKTWSPMLGRQHSDITKDKMSMIAKGKPKTEEHKAKMRLRTHTDETKNKISLSKIGKSRPSGVKGKTWWTNGTQCTMSYSCPGEYYTPGRIIKKGN